MNRNWSNSIKTVTTWLILSLCVFSSQSIYATEGTVDLPSMSVRVKSETLKGLLLRLQDASELSFFFQEDAVENIVVKNKAFKDTPLSTILDECLKETSLTYTLNGKTVTIHSKRTRPINQDQQKETNRKITGTVVDVQGEPIIGATIQLVGTVKGGISDINGQFALTVDKDVTQIKVSYIGMKSKVIDIQNTTNINVTLQQESIGLSEVVAVGYGVMKKSDLTGAVSSVKTEDLPESATTSVQHMLSGKAAGVKVTQNDAQPGGAISITVRGAASVGAGNSPLYIIDGFPVADGVDPNTGSNRYTVGTRSPLNSINPNDIESIEVLKDASATAIYGARAANGVILITTKNGKKGKVKVDYGLKTGVQNISKPWDVLDAQGYMQATNRQAKEKWMMDNKVGVYGNADAATITPWVPTYTEDQMNNSGPGTDWFDLVTRQGKIIENNVTISGANEKTNYLISVNHFDQDGVVKGNDFMRLTGRVNLDTKINDWLKVGIRSTGSRVNYNNASMGTGINEYAGVIETAMRFTPTLDVKDEDGNYTLIPGSPFYPNPVSLLEITNETQKDRLLAQGYVEISPLKNLKMTTKVGVDQNRATTKLYLPKTTLYGERVGGQANITQNNREDYLFNTTLSYQFDLFKNHHISSLVGYEYQKFTWEGHGLGNNKFTTDAFLYNNIGAGEGEKPGVSSYQGEDVLASYFGRLLYNINDKYLFTFTLRADGSTKFGKNNKWGYFPSGALAWRINNEPFMESQEWISNLKLRLSAGQTGNSNISGAFAYYNMGHNWIFGDNVSTGSYLSSYENPSLRWETTTEYNIGADIGFWNNRVSASVEYFYKEISDLLGKKALRSFLELSKMNANMGITSSRGYEVTLSTINIDRAFKWTTNLNLSAYKDAWVQRAPGTILKSYESEKDPIRVHWGYEMDGLVQPGEAIPHMPSAIPGWQKVKDINGFDENNNKTGEPDGKLNEADMVKIANEDPSLIIGFTNTFEYKNFDLNIHMYGMLGIKKTNAYLEDGQFGYELSRGQNKAVLINDSWSSENPNGKYPNSVARNPYAGGYQFLLQDASFIRVKNITMGYTFDKLLQHTKFLQKARVYVDVSNPFIITDYEGGDPEFGGLYPPQTSYTLGLNISF
ncbi:TonB-dependent receptor [Halosquirtibacter xylanolyticus]|uniref:TonB-dependent receptor n=1 Tax=Halosquirtibacter xylanolyticus TaxID=3374599 RepID=UPI00374983B2|nr:TonB-dependent receptor [Prolixibacteraceae bacterium]